MAQWLTDTDKHTGGHSHWHNIGRQLPSYSFIKLYKYVGRFLNETHCKVCHEFLTPPGSYLYADDDDCSKDSGDDGGDEGGGDCWWWLVMVIGDGWGWLVRVMGEAWGWWVRPWGWWEMMMGDGWWWMPEWWWLMVMGEMIVNVNFNIILFPGYSL